MFNWRNWLVLMVCASLFLFGWYSLLASPEQTETKPKPVIDYEKNHNNYMPFPPDATNIDYIGYSWATFDLEINGEIETFLIWSPPHVYYGTAITNVD